MKARTDSEARAHLAERSAAVPIAGCWLWLGGLDKDGYGQTSYRGRNIRAHRLSWRLAGNADAPALLHRCDITSCINPHHLQAGTQAENTADKMAKGRHRVAAGDDHYMRRTPEVRSGERAPHARLTAQQVIAIRLQSATGALQADLAQEFGVTRACISAIVIGRTWKHLYDLNQPKAA